MHTVCEGALGYIATRPLIFSPTCFAVCLLQAAQTGQYNNILPAFENDTISRQAACQVNEKLLLYRKSNTLFYTTLLFNLQYCVHMHKKYVRVQPVLNKTR